MGPPGLTREGYAHDNPETDAAGRAHSPWRSGCEQHRRLGSTRHCRRPAGAAHGARADRGAALPRAGTRGDPGRTRGRPAAARARQRDHRLLDALRDRGRPGSGDLRRRPRRGGGPGPGVSPRKSGVGAIGYTQVLPSTARLYEPGLTTAQLYDRGTNLRLGFRYLRDLLERYEGNADAKLRLALLAYNRGPARVQELLDAGKDPQNGYAAALMKGYRRKS